MQVGSGEVRLQVTFNPVQQDGATHYELSGSCPTLDAALKAQRAVGTSSAAGNADEGWQGPSPAECLEVVIGFCRELRQLLPAVG